LNFLQAELQNLWISCYHKLFPKQNVSEQHCSLFSLTLPCSESS